jgi:LysM repeat protein
VLSGPSDPVTGELEACPYLGLPDDPRTRFTFATPAHRCHVKRKPSQIDLGHQGRYCLSSDFPACKRYRAPAVAANAPVAPPPSQVSPAARPPEVAPTVVVSSSAVRARPEPQDTPPVTRSRRLSVRRVLVVLVVLGGVLLIGAIVVATIRPTLGGTGLGSVTTAPTTPAAAATIEASRLPTRSPTPSPKPSPSPSPTTTVAPSATSPPPPVQTIRIVKRGESLTSIAAEYGVTPQAITHANNIEDPNLIRVGQRLMIPRP